MFSTSKYALLAAAPLALFAAEAAFAGPMVVRSTGPSAKAYPVGKPLAADAKLALKAGDMVTVMDNGGTRTLKGPGTVAIAGAKAASGAGFSQLIANAGARQTRTGATRSAVGGGPARSPNVWFVDASKGGAFCVADAASLSLWRPDASAAGAIAVTRVSDGKTVSVDYRAGQSVREWPAGDLPVAEGVQFKIAVPGAKAPVTVKTALVAAASDVEGIGATLLGKGCANQLDVLVDGTKQEDAQIASAH